jgi:hypothetical protein
MVHDTTVSLVDSHLLCFPPTIFLIGLVKLVIDVEIIL